MCLFDDDILPVLINILFFLLISGLNQTNKIIKKKKICKKV